MIPVTGLRAPMAPLAREVRAYFAPVARETGTPSIFDPARDGAMLLDAPPAPWISAGRTEKFKRTSETRFSASHSGAKGAIASQSRLTLAAKVECEFRDWGKLQMALSCGSQHMNVLATDLSATRQPLGGIALGSTPVLPTSTATEIVFGVGAVDSFQEGDLIAVDVDYQSQTGFVGSGVAGGYVKNPADVNFDLDHIRRVTFNVGRVASKTTTSVMLSQPLIGGAPVAGAQAQRVTGFVDHEGGSFFQEWSGLFVVDSEAGGRHFFYYPRLQPSAGAREDEIEVGGAFQSAMLHASFAALPFEDPTDHEQVVCYRSYVPAISAAVY